MITSILVPVRSERLISVRLISWADAALAIVAATNRAASVANSNLRMAVMLGPPLQGRHSCLPARCCRAPVRAGLTKKEERRNRDSGVPGGCFDVPAQACAWSRLLFGLLFGGGRRGRSSRVRRLRRGRRREGWRRLARGRARRGRCCTRCARRTLRIRRIGGDGALAVVADDQCHDDDQGKNGGGPTPHGARTAVALEIEAAHCGRITLRRPAGIGVARVGVTWV